MTALLSHPIVDSTPRQHVTSPNTNKRNRRRRNRNNMKNNALNCNSSTDSSSVSSSDNNNNNNTRRRRNNNNKKAVVVAHKKQPSDEIKSQYLALDCEMVGVGQYGQRSSLARVVLCDWNGTKVYDVLVKQTEPVTDYRTHVSGITEEQLCSSSSAAIDLDECRAQVSALIADKVIVGHALKNDFTALGIHHEWQFIRDTAKYEPFMKVRFVQDGILWPRKLKDLANDKLEGRIIQTGIHCPLEDAQTAMDLYIKARYKWEKAMDYKINKTKQIQRLKENTIAQ